MAEGVAIINRAGRADHAAFDSVLSRSPEAISQLGPRACWEAAVPRSQEKLSMRSLKIADLTAVARPELRALVEATVRYLA